MGLVVFGAIGLYLLLSLGVVVWAISHAGRRGKKVWRWGWGAALVMFMIPCWDWIPTVVVHKYYCEKEAGFWVYKTLDQWNAENPGVMEKLVANKGVSHSSQGNYESYVDTFPINQRFNLIAKHQGPFFMHRWRREDELVDSKKNEILARYVDYSTSQYRRQAGWSGWKFWLDREQCVGGMANAIKSGNWMEQFKGAVK